MTALYYAADVSRSKFSSLLIREQRPVFAGRVGPHGGGGGGKVISLRPRSATNEGGPNPAFVFWLTSDCK